MKHTEGVGVLHAPPPLGKGSYDHESVLCVYCLSANLTVGWGLLDVNGVRWLGALVRVTQGMSPGSVVTCVLVAHLSGCWEPRMFPTMRTSELLHPCQWTVRFLPEAGAVLKPLPSVSLARGHVWPWGVCLEGELQSWVSSGSPAATVCMPASPSLLACLGGPLVHICEWRSHWNDPSLLSFPLLQTGGTLLSTQACRGMKFARMLAGPTGARGSSVCAQSQV